MTLATASGVTYRHPMSWAYLGHTKVANGTLASTRATRPAYVQAARGDPPLLLEATEIPRIRAAMTRTKPRKTMTSNNLDDGEGYDDGDRLDPPVTMVATVAAGDGQEEPFPRPPPPSASGNPTQ